MYQTVALRSLRSLNRLATLRAVHTSRVVLAPKRAPPNLNDWEHHDRERVIKKSQQRAEAMYALATVSEKCEQSRTREEFRNNLKELESVLEPYINLYAEKYRGMELDGQPVDDGTQPFREKLEEVRSILAELDRQDRAHG